MRLADQTILITGAAKRIGRSLALAAAREGANIIIHHNQSPAEATDLQEQIRHLGKNACIYQSDFSSPLAVQEFAEKAFSSGPVDAVINNASIFTDLKWDSTTAEDWILDWRALRPGPDHLPYTISKAGLASLTKSLAVSLAPGITVNGIALGAILPPSDGGAVEDLISSLPIPRWAEMEELEETLIFLLSGPAYITGEIIHLDGGRHLI